MICSGLLMVLQFLIIRLKINSLPLFEWAGISNSIYQLKKKSNQHLTVSKEWL